MLEKSFGILFYLKKPKNYVSGAMPIYLRITVNSLSKELTVKQECEPDRWNSNTQRAKGTNEKSKSLNYFLDTVVQKIHQARNVLLEQDLPITADALKSVLIGKEEHTPMLLEEFKKHNKQLEALKGVEYAQGTIQKYETALSHVKTFIADRYKANDIAVKELSYEFINDFSFWLKTERKCNQNSTIKYITNLRKIVNHCLKSGWLHKDPFIGFKMAKKQVIREYLTDAEIQALTAKNFSIERLAIVRDVFLFSCYTGLAFIDVFQLRPNNIAIGIDGKDWIFTARQKTDVPTKIPLLPKAKAIIKKYKDNPKCISENKLLPVLSNQKMNAYLKEIADLCEIRKTLTFHIARHTFATTVTLSNGVPIETVSKLLGHSSIKMTQHYAKIIDRKISEDMNFLQRKLSLS